MADTEQRVIPALRMTDYQLSKECQVGGLVHFVIDDVTAWHREFEAKGVKASDPPNDDLGFLNMTVTDPDGNQLRFMERANKDAAPA